MEHNISFVPAIAQITKNISGTVNTMRIEVDGMQAVITSLDKEVYGITDQVNNITGQMQLLDPAVQHIGRDVNRMSGPMRMFNNFNPFD